jgi:hypothetical protein
VLWPQVYPGKTLYGILYVLKTGCAWPDLQRKYGSYTTYWWRLKEWQRMGIWERICKKLLQMLDEKRAIDWSNGFLDGSFVQAKRGGDQVGKPRLEKGRK